LFVKPFFDKKTSRLLREKLGGKCKGKFVKKEADEWWMLGVKLDIYFQYIGVSFSHSYKILFLFL